MEESWKDIKGFEGLYQVSNLGRVKTLEKEVSHSRNKLLKVKRKSIIKKQVFNKKNGYMYVSLNKDKKMYNFSIHRLVAIHFIDNFNNKSEVNHIDGNKTNNTILNLEWVNAKENTNHSFKIGHPSKRIKLNVDKVIEIRKLYSTGNYTLNYLSKVYEVKTKTIKKVINRETWNFK